MLVRSRKGNQAIGYKDDFLHKYRIVPNSKNIHGCASFVGHVFFPKALLLRVYFTTISCGSCFLLVCVGYVMCSLRASLQQLSEPSATLKFEHQRLSIWLFLFTLPCGCPMCTARQTRLVYSSIFFTSPRCQVDSFQFRLDLNKVTFISGFGSFDFYTTPLNIR